MNEPLSSLSAHVKSGGPAKAANGLLLQVTLGSLGVAIVTAACFFARLDFQVSGFLYLIVVVLVSLSGGYVSAAIVSVVAASCLEFFFIPPVLTWRINSPQDLWALVSYLVTSLVITRLASSARNQTRIAETKRKDVARLYETASRLLSLEPEVAAGDEALRIFREKFGLRAVCLFDSTTASEHVEGEPQHALVQETRNAFVTGRNFRDPEGWVHVHCLRIDGKPAGAIGFEGRFEGEDEAALGPLFALAATAFERASSFRSASLAAAASQAEMLRSAILDAFAHEFKTPQAVIMAAAGSLRETGGLRTEQVEMTDVIETEVWRMARLTTRLLRMARIDRDEVRPNMEVTSLDRLIAHYIRQHRGVAEGRQISLKLRSDAPEVLVDPELMNLAFVQLLDNACKYSTPGTPVTVEIDLDGEFADIFVTNEGGFIRTDERDLVFERFYRGTEAEHGTSGAGLGLFVARKITRAHGGNLELYENPAASGTTTFRMRLPIARRETIDERKAS
jgi:two-component system sensor histidine kinase KdpD